VAAATAFSAIATLAAFAAEFSVAAATAFSAIATLAAFAAEVHIAAFAAEAAVEVTEGRRIRFDVRRSVGLVLQQRGGTGAASDHEPRVER
jgi:hypothetical protein